jgi:hypothetical protein
MKDDKNIKRLMTDDKTSIGSLKNDKDITELQNFKSYKV